MINKREHIVYHFYTLPAKRFYAVAVAGAVAGAVAVAGAGAGAGAVAGAVAGAGAGAVAGAGIYLNKTLYRLHTFTPSIDITASSEHGII